MLYSTSISAQPYCEPDVAETNRLLAEADSTKMAIVRHGHLKRTDDLVKRLRIAPNKNHRKHELVRVENIVIKTFPENSRYLNEDIENILHKIIFQFMLEYPARLLNILANSNIAYAKFLKIQKDDNKSWHNDPDYLPTRARMLSKLAEVVYKLRNEITFESITLGIEGYICPRSILRDLEATLFYGSQLKSFYEDSSTIKIRGNSLLKLKILILMFLIQSKKYLK